MRVRIDVGLDLEGLATFNWEPDESALAVDVPKNTLERWATEREAFHVAYLRYKRVLEEIDDTLYRAESARTRPDGRKDSQPVPALAAAVAQSKAKYR